MKMEIKGKRTNVVGPIFCNAKMEYFQVFLFMILDAKNGIIFSIHHFASNIATAAALMF